MRRLPYAWPQNSCLKDKAEPNFCDSTQIKTNYKRLRLLAMLQAVGIIRMVGRNVE
jgi:hypothetical protein